jgi:nucleoid-associated protein YgaU
MIAGVRTHAMRSLPWLLALRGAIPARVASLIGDHRLSIPMRAIPGGRSNLQPFVERDRIGSTAALEKIRGPGEIICSSLKPPRSDSDEDGLPVARDGPSRTFSEDFLVMPNDAKIGLVVGVGLVVVVALVFFRKDEPAPRTMALEHRPLIHESRKNATPASPREHKIQAGETLFSIAERYYGDGERFVDLYQANRQLLKNPDHLPAGTVIRLP